MNAKSPSLKVSILTVTAASVLAVTAAHAGELIRTRGHKVDGQYIVVLRDDAAALSSERSRKPKAVAIAADMARAHGAKLRYAYGHALRGFAVNASEASLKRLLADPRVAYVEEDAVVFADTTQPNATWGLDRIDQRSIDRRGIDQRNRPLSSSYSYDTTAATVHAYIIDTGIRASHTDFGDRVSGGYSAIRRWQRHRRLQRSRHPCRRHRGRRDLGRGQGRPPASGARAGLQRVRLQCGRDCRHGLGGAEPRQAGRGEHESGRWCFHRDRRRRRPHGQCRRGRRGGSGQRQQQRLQLLARARRFGDHRGFDHLVGCALVVLQLRLLCRPLRAGFVDHVDVVDRRYRDQRDQRHLDGFAARRRGRRGCTWRTTRAPRRAR